MPYKLLILAPSAGGKSTLMRYLREHTDLVVAETDEEVMRANNDIWPDDDLKNKVLVPQTTKEIIGRESVIYLASYVPDELIGEARSNGFKVALFELTIQELRARNKKRMEEEGYQDATPWLKLQLDTYERLQQAGLIDIILEGNQSVEALTEQVLNLTKNDVRK